ncbi:hypothetical protein ACFQ1E_20760 [Sphingomonas canadensis]|uniref:Uncharacterized protein n=1 Tax=Sphingomonas canadensis TaxID=1219257 RepID=A0ABW3HC53_9SPHN|nr:hypothetical protein [Sphingomonas canadensis]MCW3838474.1 hypothetical protein [Sphingomonas canadensis]
MSLEEKELLVRAVKAEATGHLIVIGIPNNGKTIRVGDIFTTRYEAPQTVEDILVELPRPTPTNRAEIALTVVAIDSMRQQIDELPHGVTGALRLAGSGMESVAPNCFLLT